MGGTFITSAAPRTASIQITSPPSPRATTCIYTNSRHPIRTAHGDIVSSGRGISPFKFGRMAADNAAVGRAHARRRANDVWRSPSHASSAADLPVGRVRAASASSVTGRLRDLDTCGPGALLTLLEVPS